MRAIFTRRHCGSLAEYKVRSVPTESAATTYARRHRLDCLWLLTDEEFAAYQRKFDVRRKRELDRGLLVDRDGKPDLDCIDVCHGDGCVAVMMRREGETQA